MVIELHAVLYINFELSIGVKITSCVLTFIITVSTTQPSKCLVYSLFLTCALATPSDKSLAAAPLTHPETPPLNIE